MGNINNLNPGKQYRVTREFDDYEFQRRKQRISGSYFDYQGDSSKRGEFKRLVVCNAQGDFFRIGIRYCIRGDRFHPDYYMAESALV